MPHYRPAYSVRGMADAPANLAERLALARKRAGYTQVQVALLAKMSQVSYSDLERGKSQATVKVGSLAHALGVNALWLETGAGPMLPGRVAEDPAVYLPADVRAVVDWFAALNNRKKRAVLDLIQGDIDGGTEK